MVDDGNQLPDDEGLEYDDLDELVEDQGDVAPSSANADDATESLRELVTYIVHNLVDDPESAEITADRRGASVYIQVRLSEDDLGKVIGRGGRIAKAIRTVLLVAGSRHHLRVSLDIES
ncbi:MAG TPA: KH domain-containing protein [Thermomicrobiales bacterium]|nr:KH domain-containing protein [Thermomicrobiales bacterium]